VPREKGKDPFHTVLWVKTRKVYESMNVVQERTSANTPTVAYTRGLDPSGTLQGAGGIAGMLARSHGYSAGNWLRRAANGGVKRAAQLLRCLGGNVQRVGVKSGQKRVF
jgi:hypothetical protein